MKSSSSPAFLLLSALLLLFTAGSASEHQVGTGAQALSPADEAYALGEGRVRRRN